jgi:acyl-CoA thioesterase FadM
VNLLLRVIWILLTASWRGRLKPLDESLVHLIVLPNDLDIHIHMNNGRFLSVMDLGRLDLMARCGLGKLALQQRWIPMVGAATIRYRRPLKLWQRFTLKTNIVFWDDKWFYLTQSFESKGELVATARIKGLLRSQQGNITPHAALIALGYSELPSPPPPADLEHWNP